MYDLRIGNRVGNKNKKGNISIFSLFVFRLIHISVYNIVNKS